MNDEKWMWIEGYEGFYMVSSRGRVMSAPRKTGRSFWPGRILKPQLASGYLRVSLSFKGATKQVQIHRAVAQAFIENRDGKPEVNHKDGDKTNNNVSNLEWVTRSENVKHSYDNLYRKEYDHFHPVKLTEEEATEILKANGTNADIGKAFGISDVMVGRIKAGKSWRHLSCQSIT